MRAFGDFVGKQIERRLQLVASRKVMAERIGSTLEARTLHSVFQPIFELSEQRIAGFESLTRFEGTPVRAPDLWFREAGGVGLGEALEMAAIETALKAAAG